jgi:hypothetical protein
MDAAATTTKRPTRKTGKPKTGAKVASAAITLAELADRYAHHLAQAGKTLGTQFSYRMELNTALEELGPKTPITTLTTEQVQDYFRCERVTKTRGGREKARPTIDKTRRVLRLALVWAAEQGQIEIFGPDGEYRAEQYLSGFTCKV